MAVRVLVVEQAKQMRVQFVSILEEAGHQVFAASNLPEAAELFAKHGIDVVLLDQLLASGDVNRFCAGVLGAIPSTRVIATTASGSMRKAAEALEIGAFDYLVKPATAQQLLCIVENAERAVLKPEERISAGEIAYQNAWLGPNYKLALAHSQSSAPIFLYGETGVGKSRCAEWMHKISQRAQLPYVVVDCVHIQCGALVDHLPAALIQNGGTLVLKEPRKLRFAMQTQILRFLQTSLLELAGEQQQFANIRLICCSETAPEQDVDAGQIREDLFYRLKVMRMAFPSIRDRGGDICEIAHNVLGTVASEMNKSFQSIDRAVQETLCNLVLPRNLLDLEDLIRAAVAGNDGNVLQLEMLPVENMQMSEKNQGTPLEGSIVWLGERTIRELLDEGLALADFEKLMIEFAIERCGGSVTKAARHLDVSPSTIYRKRTGWRS